MGIKGKSQSWPLLQHALLFILSTWLVVDVIVNHTGDYGVTLISWYHIGEGEAGTPIRRSSDTEEEWPGQAEICSRREGYTESSNISELRYKSRIKEGENPWHQMKWVGEAAPCRVKGHLIEKLDDLRNFRRGYALRFTPDVEDRTHVLPWMLASKIDLNQRERRVYLDLGANRFNSSLTWFLRMYPCDFTEIHAFEFSPHWLQKPSQGFDEQANLRDGSPWSFMTKATPEVPQWMLERINIHYNLVGDEDDKAKKSINITRFIKEELQLKATDTVVVKMDIEGSEWPVLKRWNDDPEMPNIIDELFVEVHYNHPSMHVYGWHNFGQITRQNAKDILGDLRWHGFFVHFWP